MAYFFLPSSIQKRLLRYALSQVDLLDTEALDLEKLDIAWGKKSTVELHDVGLSKSKLASLISLPQQLNIKHAAVAIVKITVPADIHTSSIVIAISGARVALNFGKDDDADEAGPESSFPGVKGTALPSVHNLTKSFLAEEPITRQKELAAALATRPSDLRQSVVSVTSTDSEVEEGVGTGIGLPGFLTAFFYGIGERLQVVFEDVAFTLDLDGLTDDDYYGERAVPAALALEIASIDVRDQKSETGSASKRQVVLEQVRCSLLDERSDKHVAQAASPDQTETTAYSLQDALRACRADIEARPSSIHRLRRSFDGSGARTPTSPGPQRGASTPVHTGSKASSPISSNSHRVLGEDVTGSDQVAPSRSYSNTLSVSGGGDLTQSTLFSKDDAESLYMSALDDSSPVASFRAEMPGGWGMDSEISSWTHRHPLQHDTQSNNHSERLPGRGANQYTLPALAYTYRVLAVLDRVELWIPSETVQDNDTLHAPTSPHHKDGRTSTSSAMPSQTYMTGSFSTYANRRPQERGSTKVSVRAPVPTNHGARTGEQIMSDTLETIAGSMSVNVDLPTVQLLLSMNKQFQAKVNDTQLPQSSHEGVQSWSRSIFSLGIQIMSINIVETLEQQTWQSVIAVAEPIQPQNALCNLKLQDTRLVSRKDQLRCDISKASVTMKNQTIITFDEQVRKRTSVRDLREQSVDDISVIFGVEGGKNAVNVATKPLKILIDVDELGDMIESFGGLSTILGLFQSFSSQQEHTRAPVDRRRVVRFESASREKALQVENDFRLNVRLGGMSLIVRGSRQTLKCDTSALKFISRYNVFGLSIDDIKLLGPFSGASQDSSIALQMNNLRLKHLATPEEADLTRLIALLTPSKERFGDDDDVLVDTLLRQRRKGATLRVSLSNLELDVSSRSMALEAVQDFSDDCSRLSTIAQYLPEDDRPGLMVLANIEETNVNLETEHAIGTMNLSLHKSDFAHVSIPSLFACSVEGFDVERNDQSTLITQVTQNSSTHRQPIFTARMIGDEPEPVVKIRLWNMMFEYNIPLIVAALGISDLSDTETLVTDLAASIASLSTSRSHKVPLASQRSAAHRSKVARKEYCLDLGLRDCAVGLKPKTLASKALFLLSDATLTGSLPNTNGMHGQLNIRKGAVLLVDDVNNLIPHATSGSAFTQDSSKDQIAALCKLGFVPVSSMSAAVVDMRLKRGGAETIDSLEVSFKDELFVLETCADSTQTLLETLNDLMPPMPPPKGLKYRTEVTPVQDMLASFSGNAFDIKSESGSSDLDTSDVLEDEADLDQDYEDLGVTASTHNMKQSLPSVPNGVKARGSRFGSAPHRLEELRKTERKDAVDLSRRPSAAKKWDSVNNRYIPMATSELASMPLHVKVREVHFIWHLFDGYDWQQTRNTITKAVHDVENRAEERRRRPFHDEEQESEPLIGDFLFNSIYIGVPPNADPQDLTRQINRNMDDLVSETASLASTATTSRPNSAHRVHAPHRKLKLTRSKRHKLAIELRGVSADVFMLGPEVETQSSIDIRVTDLDIFDHVPTSTWKKFATYMHDAGPREGQPMVHLEICNVRPIPELLASELVIRATVLPIRLHVDQDALDFMTRFFEFKDDSAALTSTPMEEPYLQRVEVLAVPVKMDYKPKKVDFAGLRSGRTTEFMNFWVLESADFTLKHTIVYGTSGFTKLRQSLEDVWMPDVKHNQLPTVLAGLQGVRTVVNVGTGVRDLVMIPIQEYKKDGRIVRSISKGAAAFAKTTGGELTKFGARLAIGAQNALQGAEAFLVGEATEQTWDDDDDTHDEEKRVISHYANQPAGILQGLRGAARSLERDILVTKDAIIAISGEMRETGTAEGAARAVARHGPTLILRPMIGASKAISQTLMGATNTVDPQNRRRVEDKYKKY